MSIPEVLKRYSLVNPVTISERKVLSAFDTVNQSLAAGAVASPTVNTAATVASSPALGQVGSDIVLTAGQVLIVERLALQLLARDNSGKIKVQSAGVYDSIGTPVFSLKSQASPLPYTFAALVNDTVLLVADPEEADSMVIDPDSTALSGVVLNFGTSFVLVNTDGAAAHLYQRSVTLTYRIVSGVDPGTPRVITLD